jgi:hypothetical protein
LKYGYVDWHGRRRRSFYVLHNSTLQLDIGEIMVVTKVMRSSGRIRLIEEKTVSATNYVVKNGNLVMYNGANYNKALAAYALELMLA